MIINEYIILRKVRHWDIKFEETVDWSNFTLSASKHDENDVWQRFKPREDAEEIIILTLLLLEVNPLTHPYAHKFGGEEDRK